MCVLSIKVPIQKKSGNLFNDPRNIKKKYVDKQVDSKAEQILRAQKIGYQAEQNKFQERIKDREEFFGL